MLSRRDLLGSSLCACLAPRVMPTLTRLVASAPGPVRCINVVNFMRGVEPRGPVDLMLPAQKQMEVIVAEGLPATWLLQFDALVSGDFVPFLKAHMPPDHEVGIWFEMNEMHCKAAGVAWRGRPGYEWDHYPSVAFTIGYTPEERIKLADTFMEEFKKIWGKYPKSVASWNLDAITMAHLTTHYGVDAYAVCRDQIATDGFTIWGAPIAGYYPSTKNCWSPALDRRNQIGTPVFRMLGQDPVYYYQSTYPLHDGRRIHSPDTMEPVWPSGRSPEFIRNFLEMIAESPTLGFAYAQLGQENNFGWPDMQDAYPRQMKALKELHAQGKVRMETMGESGRRFKRAFRQTPAQAQVMLSDPYDHADHAESTIWYQSRFYRANLHIQSDRPFLRDLTVYRDEDPQPFLTEPTRLNDVEQRLPAILDGYHWSKTPGSVDPGAGGFFLLDGNPVRMTSKPTVREEGSSLIVGLNIQANHVLVVRFDERTVSVFTLPANPKLTLSFEWDAAKAALTRVEPHRLTYRWQDLTYSVAVSGKANATSIGWDAQPANGQIRLTF